jgi:Tol biopolymer transport system component
MVFGLTVPADPRLSPDGARIVYSLTTTDRESKRTSSQLWLCDVNGANARRLTASGERNRGGRWSPDGRFIAFISDRVRRNGIFVLPVAEPGEAREVTRDAGEIVDIAWSPDGRRIAYVVPVDPEHPDEAEPPPGAAPRVRVTERLDYKADGPGYLGERRRQVFVAEVAGGERRQLTGDRRSPPSGRRTVAGWRCR